MPSQFSPMRKVPPSCGIWKILWGALRFAVPTCLFFVFIFLILLLVLLLLLLLFLMLLLLLLLFLIILLLLLQVFEPFLKAYYSKFAYKSIDSSQFKDYFLDYFTDVEAVKKIDWDTWLHGTGMPIYKPRCLQSNILIFCSRCRRPFILQG